MNLHKRFTTVLILLLLVSAVVAAFHHHENFVDDHDCPICVASHHAPATGPFGAALDEAPCFAETSYSVPAPVITDNTLVSLLKNRAPPA